MTKQCAKEDTGVIKAAGASFNQRKLLFYGICIWVRFGLVYLSYKFYDKPWFLYLALIGSILSIITIRINKDDCVWWSRRFHYINLLMILYVALIQLITKDRRPVISIILFIDIIVGILHSFFKFNK